MNFTKPRYRPAEAAELLGISRSKVYARIKEGRLKTVRDGKTDFIPGSEIIRYASEPHPCIEYPTRREPSA